MKRFLVGLLVVIGSVWVGIRLEFPTWVIRYRPTLTAEVDGREISGSGVVETRWASEGFFTALTGVPWNVSVRGEAVVVDLGARGILFALLRTDRTREGSYPDPQHMVSRTFADVSVGSMNSASLRKMGPSTGPVALELRALPMLVRFRDLADPKSVERVDPTDLAASFGPGVRLAGATIAIVPTGWRPFDGIYWPVILAGEPVTTGIEKRFLPWFAERQKRWASLAWMGTPALLGGWTRHWPMNSALDHSAGSFDHVDAAGHAFGVSLFDLLSDCFPKDRHGRRARYGFPGSPHAARREGRRRVVRSRHDHGEEAGLEGPTTDL